MGGSYEPSVYGDSTGTTGPDGRVPEILRFSLACLNDGSRRGSLDVVRLEMSSANAQNHSTRTINAHWVATSQNPGGTAVPQSSAVLL